MQQLEALEALHDELAHPRVNAAQVRPSRARPPQLLLLQLRVCDFTGAGRFGHACARAFFREAAARVAYCAIYQAKIAVASA